MSFRDNLRETLDYMGMEQKELASKTGLSLKTIENYVKKDSSLPTVDKAVTIAREPKVRRPRRISRIPNDRQKNQKRNSPRHTAPTQRNPGHSIKVEQNQLRSNHHSSQNLIKPSKQINPPKNNNLNITQRKKNRPIFKSSGQYIHCSLFTFHCSLFIAHCSLLIAH